MNKWSFYKYFLPIILAVSLGSCVQGAGLVLEGNVSLPKLPKGEELWLGLWIENAEHPSPFSGAPLVSTTVEDVITLASSTIGDFKWDTGITPEGGATLWLAAFVEQSNGANGIPDKGVTLIKADQNPIRYITDNIIKSSDGKVKYKIKITISQMESDFNPLTRIPETVDALTEILREKSPSPSELMVWVHPFYRDVFLNSYNRLADWFSGALTSSLAFGDVPLYGVLNKAARATISIDNTGFDAGSSLKIDPIGLSTESFFTYVRTDNNDHVAVRLKLFFRNDDGRAKLLEILPVYSTVESFSLTATPPLIDKNGEVLLKWDAYAKATTYRVEVERWDGTSWYTQTTAWQTRTGIRTFTLHPDCSKIGSVTCAVSVLKEDQLYRVSLTPLDNTGAEINNVFARFYLPGDLYHYGRN